VWIFFLLLILLIFGIKVAVKAANQEWREKQKPGDIKPANTPKSRSKTRKSLAANPVIHEQITGNYLEAEINWPGTFMEIDRAITLGDYDFARNWLQKFAYSTVSQEVPQQIRDRFKTLMTAFSRQAPPYKTILSEIIPLVSAQPGILQMATYPQLPTYTQEQIRYVLYFAHELGDLTRLKKGRSYQLFGPVQETVIRPGEKIGQTTATSTIVISKNPIDERIAALHREATQHKNNNWEAAVTCLLEASELMRLHGGIYVMDRWTRLPVFLQQAGRFDEAMLEFERLLSEVESRVDAEFEHSKPIVKEKYVHLNYQKIYDKMRMVCKRQKLTDKTIEYGRLAEEHRQHFDILSIR